MFLSALSRLPYWDVIKGHALPIIYIMLNLGACRHSWQQLAPQQQIAVLLMGPEHPLQHLSPPPPTPRPPGPAPLPAVTRIENMAMGVDDSAAVRHLEQERGRHPEWAAVQVNNKTVLPSAGFRMTDVP